MTRAEMYVALSRRCNESYDYGWAVAWQEAADHIAMTQEMLGRGEQFWAEVDLLIEENK